MQEDSHRPLLLSVGVLLGYALVMASNPARPSLRDGLRCLQRYPQIWLLPAGFALAHSGFRLWRHCYETWLVPGAGPVFVPWGGWQPPPWRETVAASWLPTAESTAAIFNCIVTTFPLSSVAALLFLFNWRGYQAALYKGVHRRFGVFGGATVHCCLLLSALAAVCKPVLFGGLPLLNGYFGAVLLLRLGEVVNSLGFLFEYLLGVAVQIYTVLLCFAWVRGLTFDIDALRRFALRRFAFVVKWAAVVILVSSLSINAPLIASTFQPSGDSPVPGWTDDMIHGTRWLLSVILVIFCSMQILLIFHNESLRQALGDHFRLLRRYGGHVGWLLLVVALHYFALALADAFLPLALGPWTWLAATWSLLVHPILWTALAGWFVASWVCLFQRCERNRPDTNELVRF